MSALATYSFLDVVAALVGPGGAISLGSGAGNAEEGISVEPTEDIDSLTVGADGASMHSLHADRSGHITIRLLKTSPVNSLLAALYNFQTASGSTHGKNVLTIANKVTGDVITCQSTAFKKAPSLTYAKEGGMNEWEFNAGNISRVLGALT